MRISCDPTDPGIRVLAGLRQRRATFEVFVDGVIVPLSVLRTADEEEGFAELYVKTATGTFQLTEDRRNVVLDRRCGKVRVVVHEYVEPKPAVPGIDFSGTEGRRFHLQ